MVPKRLNEILQRAIEDECAHYLLPSGIEGSYDRDKLRVLEAFHNFAVSW